MKDKRDKSKRATARSPELPAPPVENTTDDIQNGPEIIEIPPDPQARAEARAEEEQAEEQTAVQEASTVPEAAPETGDVVEDYNVPKVKDMAEARCVLEALLFTTVEPLPLKQLSALLPPLDPPTIRKLIVELQSDYDAQRRGLQIVEVGTGFQMASRPEYGKWVLGLLPHRRKSALSTAALETLAIVAYKQPVTRVEVDQIRGVDSSGTMRNLLDLGLIKAAGQKEAVGRPVLYVTTDHFLKVFGLRRLTDMPSLQELRRRYKAEPKPGADDAKAGDDAKTADDATAAEDALATADDASLNETGENAPDGESGSVPDSPDSDPSIAASSDDGEMD